MFSLRDSQCRFLSSAPLWVRPHARQQKSDQPKLTVLTYFGEPSGGQPALQAAAAALRALRAALVNAYAFPQLRALSGSTPSEVNKKDGQLSLTVLTYFGWAVRGSACFAGGRCGASRLARCAGKCLRISSAPRPFGFDPKRGQQKRRSTFIDRLNILWVGRQGVEPWTLGLRVPCSTN